MKKSFEIRSFCYNKESNSSKNLKILFFYILKILAIDPYILYNLRRNLIPIPPLNHIC